MCGHMFRRRAFVGALLFATAAVTTGCPGRRQAPLPAPSDINPARPSTDDRDQRRALGYPGPSPIGEPDGEPEEPRVDPGNPAWDPFPDDDGDGVVNSADPCPAEPGTPNGSAEGCPPLDADRDSVADLADDCVQRGENPDDANDGDGCPEVSE